MPTGRGTAHQIGALSLLSLLTATVIVAGAGDDHSEYEIKAAFLINFARFVEWPDQPNGHEPFTLCVLGRDPFGATLDWSAKGKTVNGRSLVIHRISGFSELRPCQTVFLADSEMYRFDGLRKWLGDRSVLTVGEAKGFTQRGGIMNLELLNDRVAFAVNRSAAARAHLKISSRLLQLATTVDGGVEAKP